MMKIEKLIEATVREFDEVKNKPIVNLEYKATNDYLIAFATVYSISEDGHSTDYATYKIVLHGTSYRKIGRVDSYSINHDDEPEEINYSHYRGREEIRYMMQDIEI